MSALNRVRKRILKSRAVDPLDCQFDNLSLPSNGHWDRLEQAAFLRVLGYTDAEIAALEDQS